jgi:hypothetical protein
MKLFKKEQNLNGPNNNHNDNQSQPYNYHEAFSMVRNLTDLTTNQQLLGYFSFLQFYGLLDDNGKETMNQVNKININLIKTLLFGFAIGFAQWRYFSKNNYKIWAYRNLLIINLPMIYIFYRKQREINFMLLVLKDRYIPKIDKFYKEGKNPMTLNNNFLTEPLADPDLRFYQDILKLEVVNKH